MNEEIKEYDIDKEIEMITIPAKPLKPRCPEHVEMARVLAKRYLTVPMLEKMINQKKESKQKRTIAAKFKAPTTPEEFYDRGEKYLNGAICAVPFQEKSKYYQRAAEMYAGAGDYQDAQELAAEYAALADQVLTEGYENAYAEAAEKKAKAATADDWFHAARAFERIPGYQDADEQAEYCEKKLNHLNSVKAPMITAVVILLVVLIFAGVQYTKTDAFKLNAAKVSYSIGLDSLATNFLKEMNHTENSDALLTEVRYDNAQNHRKAGRYSNAAKGFKTCGEYLDSVELMEECSYYAGLESMKLGEYKTAQKEFFDANGFEDADAYLLEADQKLLESTQIGDHVNFGGCECILLDNVDGKYFLLSSKLYGKDAGITFHKNRENIGWENSDLRTILNSTYMDEHFSESEQNALVSTEVQPGVNDQVFLLSKDEYERYYPVMGEKKAIWWLRDTGDHPDTAMFVSYDGEVMDAGYPVNSSAIEGRPAFWVQFN